MQVGGWTVNFLTSPGWAMALVWLLFLVVTTIFFQDVSPQHRLYGPTLASRKWRRSVHEDEENVGSFAKISSFLIGSDECNGSRETAIHWFRFLKTSPPMNRVRSALQLYHYNLSPPAYSSTSCSSSAKNSWPIQLHWSREYILVGHRHRLVSTSPF